MDKSEGSLKPNSTEDFSDIHTVIANTQQILETLTNDPNLIDYIFTIDESERIELQYAIGALLIRAEKLREEFNPNIRNKVHQLFKQDSFLALEEDLVLKNDSIASKEKSTFQETAFENIKLITPEIKSSENKIKEDKYSPNKVNPNDELSVYLNGISDFSENTTEEEAAHLVVLGDRTFSINEYRFNLNSLQTLVLNIFLERQSFTINEVQERFSNMTKEMSLDFFSEFQSVSQTLAEYITGSMIRTGGFDSFRYSLSPRLLVHDARDKQNIFSSTDPLMNNNVQSPPSVRNKVILKIKSFFKNSK